MPNPDNHSSHHAPFDAQIGTFIDQHRSSLAASLESLTEEEARRRLVPSKTTLLGLVKHAAFVERVWFGEAVTGASRAELGIPDTPDESLDLEESDTIESVLAAYAVAVEQSRRAVAGMDGDAVLPGNRRGPLPLRCVQQHMLRELAHHCGHADILRELVLAARSRTQE
ncbi:DinB family protein [Arthrobacter caoxuetaonis]|uniref:DinB family protein n=1 Tax=Arthrobacter caoxuetaonis TaxID=2886935 RepID=A0A9X1SCB3_9MICC|nr:DinB family protein [Arthrobacter caoxuetaonis]MCC3297536.1 DinB family protein [Arthrobacter caoxuetaonis]USQ57933.1 DinB family protein [Arthrobacter caoxuetaonis]